MATLGSSVEAVFFEGDEECGGRREAREQCGSEMVRAFAKA